MGFSLKMSVVKGYSYIQIPTFQVKKKTSKVNVKTLDEDVRALIIVKVDEDSDNNSHEDDDSERNNQ